MDQDQIAKLVCTAIGCVVAFYLFMWLLPYIALGMALYAFGYMVMQNNRGKDKNRRNRR